ncbi:unnamed protein product [Acanthocheilonema viteae]|uniref:Translation elongation factor EF1B beta/delta subunit guanine nucleotide exchange domain-containing protein n=1 Tax=Acanthocheilonema viteae TaxID=6277 RepID=A0A498S982_ACAVI|nr:unnamed protein product [Acanthocheilonema viteae]
MVSIESLLPEVTTLFSHQLTLKAADELFFGDKMLYHYHSNDGSKKGIPDGGEQERRKGKNKDQKNRSYGDIVHETSIGMDGLHNAIANARKTLKQALGDNNVVEDATSGALTKLTGEVAALKKISDEMRNEIEKLREDFQKILNYVHQTVSKAQYHLQLRPCMSSSLKRVGSRTLILGDGNLSFSLAFARLHPETEIYASVFESYSEYITKYPSGKKNIIELRTNHPYVYILFSIDVCSLPKDWTGFYDDIIWNFPHHCGKTNLRKSRQLIRKAFASVGRLLLSGRFHITLAKGQSGLDHLSILFKRCFKYQRLPEHRSDSWNGTDIPLPVLTKQSSSKVEKPLEASNEDDFDLFGSSDEEEDAEKERIKQERLKAYAEKKAKKPECIAKSSIILDVKPWDDTTDMQEMEKLVRNIEKDGLVWGGAKLIPLAYGIKVLQIICIVEDAKVSVDDLIDQITEEVSDHVHFY